MSDTQTSVVLPIPTPGSLPKAELSAQEVFERVGGAENGGIEAFAALADVFYAGVESDPLLRPMYPEGAEALAEARENLALFLMQYFGGPAIYAEKRGHPRLRMRHFPFTIGEAERDAWLRHMNAAVASVPAFTRAGVDDLMLGYFANAARFLQNRASAVQLGK